ncbi:MAG TPA: hypothetical protein VL492_10800 [Methylovirgula sp.]|nr:hypothetical protein [Methylovirgula sp.]
MAILSPSALISKETPTRHQVAALPYRENAKGDIQVLLLSSRDKHRLIIPKGWCSEIKAWKAAKKGAFAEAGLTGKIEREPIGQFEY